MQANKIRETDFKYDVCLSFAGEDRAYVEEAAQELVSRGIRVFYDKYEEVDLWGKDLYEHLNDIYQNSAKYCILFISRHYAEKVWTNHERRSAQARALKENSEYILPVRFDDSLVPGLRDTVGYIDLRAISPKQLADHTIAKLGMHQRCNYMPPKPDLLWERLGVMQEEEKDIVASQANGLLDVLKRMSEDEIEVVFLIFLRGCCADLPDNIHIDIDLLKRLSGFPISKLKRLLAGLRSLGFYCSIQKSEEDHDQHLGQTDLFVLEWHLLIDEIGGNLTHLAVEIITAATEKYCEVHAMEALRRLDFSQLSEATRSEDEHHLAGEQGGTSVKGGARRDRRVVS